MIGPVAPSISEHIFDSPASINYKEDIFVLPILDKFIVASPLKGSSALVNRAVIDELQDLLSGNKKITPRKPLMDLFQLLCPHVSDLPPVSNILLPSFLGFIPTRACNMQCKYCDFESDREAGGQLDAEHACHMVEWMAVHAHQTGRDRMDIHFFGGEPFMAASLIEVIVHRARMVAARYALSPHFEVSTNGYFGTKTARFVGDYIDAVVLSLDGLGIHHDHHRPVNKHCGSFERVYNTAFALSQSSTNLCLRCCVSDCNLSDLDRITQWFCEQLGPGTINFEPLSQNARASQHRINAPDPYEFARAFVSAKRIATRYGVQCIYSATSGAGPRFTFCPVGRDTLIVAPEGRISSCYLNQNQWQARGLDLDVGTIDDDGFVRIDVTAIQRLRDLVMDKPRCENCFCRWQCAGGCHINNTYPGSNPTYSDFCLRTRLLSIHQALSNLGEDALADRWLSDKSACLDLARTPSDRLMDWKAI